MSRLAAVTVSLALAAGCTPAGGGGAVPVVAAGTIAPFDACEPLLDHLQAEALERVTPYGVRGLFNGGGVYYLEEGMPVAADTMDRAAGADGAATTGAEGAPAPQAGVDFSETNNQEVGVDEPDTVKTNGQRIVAVTQGVLRIIDATGTAPRELGTLRLDEAWGHGAQLFLVGDHVVVMGTRYGTAPRPVPPAGIRAPEDDVAFPGMSLPIAVLQTIDISDPTDPEVVSQLEIDGSVVSARLVRGRIQLALASQPTGLQFTYPDEGGIRGEREAENSNREIIRESEIDDWLPYYVHTDAEGGSSEGTLNACTAVHRPAEFAGFGTVSVVTLDPGGDDLRPDDTVAVLSGGQTVYASTDRFYVATTRWFDWEAMDETERTDVARTMSTDVHAFDITDPDDVRYVASGAVTGTVLNQFSFSEHDGYLRVATTMDMPWGTSEASQSAVTVLAERGDTLDQVGYLDGLGEGERIYAVRFLGDTGYVVTFRQVDPLYVIDLSDPTNPTKTGELKILGYSSYLHPIGDDLLLGIGQDATDEGRTQGTQLAIFDVSDPTDPTRTHQLTLADASSEAEWDHHAFLYWAPTGTVVVPLQIYAWRDEPVVIMEPDGTVREEYPEPEPFVGAAAFDVDPASGIEPIGRIQHSSTDPWAGRITRSLVVGGRLYTLSERSLVASDLDTLAELGRLDLR